MERHHNNEALVIPIYMRPVDWRGALFAGIQGRPIDAKAVTEWSDPDLAFKNIAEGVRQAAEVIQGTNPGAPIVHPPLAPQKPMLTRRMWAVGVLLIIAITAAGSYVYTQHIKPVHPLVTDGERFLSTGRYQEAKSVYQQALNYGWYGQWAAGLGPEKARIYDFDNGAFSADAVAQRIDHIFKQRRNDPHAYLFQGDLAYIANDLEQAVTFYRQAIQNDANLPQAYFNLGVIYNQLGRTETALEMYENAVALAPQYSPYLNNLAHAYEQRGRHDKAISVYERALNLAPNLLITHFDLARLYRRLKTPDKALWHLQQGVSGLDNPKLAELEQNRLP